MARRRKSRSVLLGVGKAVVLLGAFGLAYALFALLGLQLALESREVAVPELTNLTPEEASATVAAANLALRIEAIRRVDQSIAPGRVTDQDPGAGVVTRRGRSVKIWLSSGLIPGAAPTLIGASERAARQRLAEASFALQGVAEIRSAQYPPDAVVAQESPPGGRGQAVWLLVNRGERDSTYVMPDLIGVDATTAAEVLRAGGFRVTVVGDHPYAGLPAGIVLRQAPQAGFQIAPGEPISLEVSQ